MTLAGHYRETLLKHYCVLGDFTSVEDYMMAMFGDIENLRDRCVFHFGEQVTFDLEQFYSYGLNQSLIIEQRQYEPDGKDWFGVTGPRNDKDRECFAKCYWSKDDDALAELVFYFAEGFDEDNTPTFDDVHVEQREAYADYEHEFGMHD